MLTARSLTTAPLGRPGVAHPGRLLAALATAAALLGAGLSPAVAATTTGPDCPYPTSAPAPDRLRTGSTLAAGKTITSPSGQFTFGVTTSGSLQLTNTNTGSRRWAQKGVAGSSLSLTTDGRATLVSPSGTVEWKSTSGTSCTELVVEDTGRLVALDHGTVLWSAPSSAVTWRDPAQYPFSETSPWNTALGSGAQFESATATRTQNLLSGNPTVNATRWSFATYQARSTDPLMTVTDIKAGRTYTLRIPADATTTYGTDKHMGVIDPGGTTAWEFYKMTRVDATHWTTTRVTQTDLKGDGAGGSRSSSTSIFAGLIRSQELSSGAIDHTLALAIPNSMLTMGYVWPARSQDGDASTNYSGTIPMGSLVGIPPSVDLSALGLSEEGMALGRALQDYGAYVLLRSSNVTLYCEQTCDPTEVKALGDAWWELYPLVRVVTNNSATTTGGGGTPRAAQLVSFN